MKRIIIIAGILALGACSESAPDAAPDEATAEPAPVDMSAWEGSYDYAYDDGTHAVLTINADGSYERAWADGEQADTTVTGTITMGENGAFCYEAEGGEGTDCWTNGEAADDGSWQATSDQGRTATVTRDAQ